MDACQLNGIPIGSPGPPSGTGRLRLSSYLGGTYAGELPCLRMRETIQLLPRVDEAFHNRCCTAVSEATNGILRFKRKSGPQLIISVVVYPQNLAPGHVRPQRPAFFEIRKFICKICVSNVLLPS